jgi:hypothetical protein
MFLDLRDDDGDGGASGLARLPAVAGCDGCIAA